MSSTALPQLTRTVLQVVPSTYEDRRAIYDMLLNSGIFGRSDADTVDQMFGEAYSKPGDDNYRFVSCWDGSEMLGFACYGRESLTQGTWDIFWACVSTSARRKGAGRAMWREIEHRARQEQVRLMVIYTSSTEHYAPARALYDSEGWKRTAVIKDYYTVSDDLCIYTKRLDGEE